ncbi:MAG: hypothetical protein G01um101433_410 [Parcubacteria group bacterium Gr01-1014_33]|nr:MAG: hypothetical protein G01um101433_410 [Parcubacteria group bacterium Gr01-1014_33]
MSAHPITISQAYRVYQEVIAIVSQNPIHTSDLYKIAVSAECVQETLNGSRYKIDIAELGTADKEAIYRLGTRIPVSVQHYTACLLIYDLGRWECYVQTQFSIRTYRNFLVELHPDDIAFLTDTAHPKAV